MNARERVLAAVRSRLGRSEGVPVAPPPPVPFFGEPLDVDAAAKVQRFRERLEAAGGVLHDGLADHGLAAVAALLERLRPRSIARSDAAAVATLREHAMLRDLRWLAPDAGKQELFAADAGVTTAQWAIAETGTLVLDMDAERHRFASLLPPVHIALLPVSRLLANLGETLKTLPRPLPASVVFVTGPSRTADIELQLVIGVHGPKELHVVLV